MVVNVVFLLFVLYTRWPGTKTLKKTNKQTNKQKKTILGHRNFSGGTQRMKVSLSLSFLETVFSTYEASRSVRLPSGCSIMSSVTVTTV